MSENAPKKTVAKKAAASKPSSPAKAEVDAAEDDAAETIKITVDINGVEHAIDLPATFDDADPDAIVALEEERPTVAFKALIGQSNWSTLKRLGWNARHFREVVEKWQQAVGLGND